MTPSGPGGDAASEGLPETTEDDFLGGALTVIQSRKGHRSGIEAVLIAAMAPLKSGETLLDIGAGAGVAALCALKRASGSKAVLVEADSRSADLARRNIDRNAMAGRARVELVDVTQRGAIDRCGLTETVDHAVTNPPFYDPSSSRTSPEKTGAHVAPDEKLESWVRFAVAALKPGGSLTLVHRAEALPLVLTAFGRRFGGVIVLPIHPRPGAPAIRIVVQGRKGRRGPLSICPGLVLHDAEGHGFRPEVDAVLRQGTAFELSR